NQLSTPERNRLSAKGFWFNSEMQGKGTYKWKKSGHVYDGDWVNDTRSGYGTLIIPDGQGGLRKLYAGGWKNNKKHGYGAYFYNLNEYYEGEWFSGKRSGWGRMYYDDGSIYEGEWDDDKRNGHGMLRMVNENRYEGFWKKDMKNGPGKFYFLDCGQLYEGVWVDDVPKCGTMIDFSRESAPQPTIYPIPKLEMQNPAEVLKLASKGFMPDEE
ncbi:MORN repeat-containing protein 3-like, partial [Argonauta hians]